MVLPQEVREILEKLNRAGHEAYAVGGCVRDACLGREPKDWDITTSALPEEVKALFPRTLDTGIQHGTVTVMRGRTGYEVTTFRVDGNYTDGRHPDSVTFTRSLPEDLKRRDFTINAMACGAGGEVVDLFDGQGDLKRRMIRCVGDPDQRFSEDALRLLRAVRFSAQLDCEIEPRTAAALKRHGAALGLVSRERVFAELNKTLLSEHPEKLSEIAAAGLERQVSEEFPGIAGDCRIAALPEDKAVRWAAAAAAAGKAPESLDRLLKELKSDNGTRETAVLLLSWLPRPLPENRAETRRLLSEIGTDKAEALLKLKEQGFGAVDASGGSGSDSGVCGSSSEAGAGAHRSPQVARVRDWIREILADGDCFSLKTLAVSGRDLMAAGIPGGPAMGACLKELLSAVLENPENNRREVLLSMAEKWCSRK